jgi:hypothetical protein
MYVCIDSSSDPLTASFWASKLEKFKKSNNWLQNRPKLGADNKKIFFSKFYAIR